MSEMLQDDYGDVGFENNEQSSPLILVLDLSDSMSMDLGNGETPLKLLQGGLDVLVAEIFKDFLARNRAEINIVCYGTDVSDGTGWNTVENGMVLPDLSTTMGITNSGAALSKAVSLVEDKIESIRNEGRTMTIPQMIWLTDGLSMDDMEPARKRIQELENKRRLSFFAIGVGEGASLEQMNISAKKQPVALKNFDFQELFKWLSMSLTSLSQSTPGDEPAPPVPTGWAEF